MKTHPVLRIVAAILCTIGLIVGGPIGCGMEAAIPTVATALAMAGLLALTIHQFQEVQSAQLDIEMKRLRLQGLRNGEVVTVEHPLSGDDYRKIIEKGKVRINGKVIQVSHTR
jgi:hypothetical protein